MATTKTKASEAQKGVKKSDAIREALAQDPKLDASKIVALLAEKGIKVSYNLAYSVKSRLRRAKRRQNREQVIEASQKMGLADPVQLILKVKALSREAGGMRSLKQLVDALAE